MTEGLSTKVVLFRFITKNVQQDFTFFKVKLSQLVHINFQAGENSHSYFFLCVEGMTEGLSRKVLLFEIIYVTFLL